MRAAERRKEIVKRDVICNIDDGETQTYPAALLPAEQAVDTGAHVKQIPAVDARRIVIIIFRPWSRDVDSRGPVLGRCTTG